jgi:hypothetical protein
LGERAFQLDLRVLVVMVVEELLVLVMEPRLEVEEEGLRLVI